MMRTFAFAAFACLLAGCAGQPPASAVASNGSKPACHNSAPPTGTHLVDHDSCDHGDASVISGTAMQNALRQANQGTGGGH